MNADLLLESTELWHLAGWTMLHFLWLGALVGLVAGACRLVVWRAAPNVRYATALACLVLMAVSPAIIVAWLVGTASPFDSPSIFAPTAPGFAGGLPADRVQNLGDPLAVGVAAAPFSTTPTTLPTPTISTTAQRTAAPTNPRQSRVRAGALDGNASSDVASVAASGPTLAVTAAAALQSCVPYLPWVWLVGTPLTFTLLTTGIIGTRRLRRASRPIADGPITELLARLAASLRVGRGVSIAVCERVAAPVLVGILRPMILLPPAALTGWSPDEIEMVLLHELAHVRRWDNAVNLAQRIVEAVLFFHPAVWLVSSWVRREREACCDAVVIVRTNRPHAYAELLVALAAQMKPSPFGRGPGEGTSRTAPTMFSPASTMAAGPLRTRIRHILQMEDDPMLVSGKSFAIVLAGLLVAATLTVLYLPAIGQAEESTANTTQAATEPKEATTNDKATDRTDPNAEELTTVDTEDTESAADSTESVESGSVLSTDKLQLNTPRGEVVIEAEDGQVKVRQNAPNAESRLETIAGEGFRATARQVESKNDGQVVLQGVQTVQRVDQSADASKNVTDDWLMGVAFPSPKEGEIARRAWKELGIKVVPASEAELEPVRSRGLAGGLKLLDFENRMNLAGPFVLTHIFVKEYAGGIANFEALRIALDELAAQPAAEVIKLEGTAKSGNVFTYSFRRPQRSATAGAANPSRFPPLADQKLADAAFRTLGWELEPIGAEDVARVKALGYDGGVRVAYAPSQSGFTNISYGHIQTGDILVGLHVWPTTKLAQVMEVLSRDDLAELNPIKFYIVRQEQILSPTEPPKTRDKAQTGRITVQVDSKTPQPQTGTTSAPLPMTWWDQGPTPARPAPSTTAPAGSVAIPQSPAVPATSDLQVPQWPAAPSGEPQGQYVPTPAQPAPSSAAPTGSAAIPQSSAAPTAPSIPEGLNIYFFHSRDSAPSRTMRLLVKRIAAVPPQANFIEVDVAEMPDFARQMNVDRVPMCVITRDRKELGRITGVQSEQQLRDQIKAIIASANSPSPGGPSHNSAPQPLLSPVDRPVLPTAPLVDPALTPAPPVSAALAPLPSPPPTAAAPDDKANLRYDGKTFDEWRTAWRTELSTEKRIGAVKALAAFGSSGYDQEAAETVLEIARQYDWRLVPGKSTNPLQDAIIDALFGSDELTRAIPAQAWFPRVMEGVRAGDKPSQQLMQWILMNFHLLGKDGEFAIDSLLELTRSDSESLRQFAARALAHLDLEHKNPQIVARLKEMLDSSDSEQIIAALENVRVSNSALPWDASHLLFHTDEKVRWAARSAFGNLRPKQEQEMSQFLMDVVNDPQRADDHVAAIRALGSLRQDATPAYATLEKRMLDRQQPLAIRVAATKALERITRNGSAQHALRGAFLEENKDRQDTPEFRGELQQLDQAMQAEEAAIP